MVGRKVRKGTGVRAGRIEAMIAQRTVMMASSSNRVFEILVLRCSLYLLRV
jgi:hypothetical protein